MAVKEYTILTGDRSTLEPLVNNAIRNGWEPLGGVCLVREPREGVFDWSSDALFSQAMVRKLQSEGGEG